MPEWLLAIILAAMGGAGGYLTAVATRRSSDRDRIKSLEERVDRVEKRELKWQNYAAELRAYITEGKPPPPPPFPDDIFD